MSDRRERDQRRAAVVARLASAASWVSLATVEEWMGREHRWPLGRAWRALQDAVASGEAQMREVSGATHRWQEFKATGKRARPSAMPPDAL